MLRWAEDRFSVPVVGTRGRTCGAPPSGRAGANREDVITAFGGAARRGTAGVGHDLQAREPKARMGLGNTEAQLPPVQRDNVGPTLGDRARTQLAPLAAGSFFGYISFFWGPISALAYEV